MGLLVPGLAKCQLRGSQLVEVPKLQCSHASAHACTYYACIISLVVSKGPEKEKDQWRTSLSIARDLFDPLRNAGVGMFAVNHVGELVD